MFSQLASVLFDGLSFGILALFTYEIITRASSMAKQSQLPEDLRIALVLVDFQNDFATGTLAIGAGDAGEDPMKKVDAVNRLLAAPFDAIIVTKDWHPADHISFHSSALNGDRTLAPAFRNREISMFEKVQFEQPPREQVLYSDHCVADTEGAELVPELHVPAHAVTVLKGLDTLVDSYSAFMDNEGEKPSELHSVLKELRIDAVIVCGLAYDICVFHTTKDARNLGYYAATARDASAAFFSSGIVSAAEYFKNHSIAEMQTDDVIEMIKSRDFPEEWQKCAEEKKMKMTTTTNNNLQ